MFVKLMKQDVRATARLMLPVYLAALILAVFVRIATSLPDSVQSTTFGSLFTGVTMALYSAASLAVAVMSFILMIWRFHKNYMTDEGYLMFTLPVTTAELIWSKLIVAIGWFLCSLVVMLLSTVILSIGSGMETTITMEDLSNIDLTQARSIILNGVLFVLMGGINVCLMFYACMAVGQSFRTHKTLMSVITFFVFYIIAQIVSVMLFKGMFENLDPFILEIGDFSSMTQLVTDILRRSIIAEFIGAAVYYVITHFMLAKKLNLQ